MGKGISEIDLRIFSTCNEYYFTGREGSGSFSDKEFASFLNISRRSVFECANILCIFVRRSIVTSEEKSAVYYNLLKLSKMITSFRKSIVKT